MSCGPLGPAHALQFVTDLPVMDSGVYRKRQHLQPRRELLDSLRILLAAARFLYALMQFAEGDCRYAKLLCALIN
jgi:hypothetical protein